MSKGAMSRSNSLGRRASTTNCRRWPRTSCAGRSPASSRPGARSPHLRPRPGLIRVLDDKPGITGGPWQMRPLSRGYVLVSSPDPREQPAIYLRYLAADTDRRAMIGGLKFLRRLFAAPSLAKYVVAETLPGPGVQSDDELLDYARANGSTVYHASCSCKMGSDETAVVDDQLKVHG